MSTGIETRGKGNGARGKRPEARGRSASRATVYRGLGVAEPVQQIAIGEYKLCSLSPRCVAKGILWLENADGEGMAFFVEKLEPVLARFFRSNF